MKIAVTGGRNYYPQDHPSSIDQFHEIVGQLIHLHGLDVYDIPETQVYFLHGACPALGTAPTDASATRLRGVDSWVETLGFWTIQFPPLQLSIGWPGCGPERNKRMIAAADVLIAFPGGKGTAGTVKLAEAKGIPIYTIGAER